jgi:hypothetical protein
VFPGYKVVNGVLAFKSFVGDINFWHVPAYPESAEIVGYSSSETIPYLAIYLIACHCHPPSQPLQPNSYFVQQSVICWSE